MEHQNSILGVVLNNLKFIGETAFTWVLTIFGLNIPSTGITVFNGVEGGLKIIALILACTVSIATLYKIKKDLEKK